MNFQRVLRSPLSGRIYFGRVKEISPNRYQAVGKKIDVTRDVQALIDEAVKDAIKRERARVKRKAGKG